MEQGGLRFSSSLDHHEPAAFSRDPKAAAILWKVREGLYPIVAASRAQGTCLMIEDVCVPQNQVGEAATDIIGLQRKFNYMINVAGHSAPSRDDAAGAGIASTSGAPEGIRIRRRPDLRGR
jgi:FAD/FMN-containing dehydrogenase